MKLRSLAKDWLASVGLRVYRTCNLPRGLDVFHDLRAVGITPGVIFDVGANAGQFAVTARKAFPQAFIHCFEPVESTYRKLQALTEGDERIRTRQTAMGAKTGSETIHLRTNSVWNSLTRFNNNPKNSDGCSELVSISTIDTYCAENDIGDIHLLKTDTEGYDINVLLGADTILSAGRIAAIYCEVTLLETDQTHTQFLEVSRLLGTHGFVPFSLYEFAGNHETMHANALFVRKSAGT